MRLLVGGPLFDLGWGPVAAEPLKGGSAVQAAGRVRPVAARRAAHGAGNGALTITASGLAAHPRRGKANPDPTNLDCCGRHPAVRGKRRSGAARAGPP